MDDGTSTSQTEWGAPSDDEAPVLVVVVNRPVDLERALKEGWYRIPLSSAPSRIAAEYLAFYQTGAFDPGDRFLIRWMAPVRSYSLATRRELIPTEPGHPRADQHYFKVLLGEPSPLPHAIPSCRLRRIVFIPTTLGRLERAKEINDLWIKSTAQERLWEALRQSELDGECQYPLQDDLPGYVADFAIFCAAGRIAVVISESSQTGGKAGENREIVAAYLANSAGWRLFRLGATEVETDPSGAVEKLQASISALGGLAKAAT